MSGNGLRDELVEVLASTNAKLLWPDLDWGELYAEVQDSFRRPMEPLADAVLPVVQARIDAAREQATEQIAQAIETAASKWADDLYTSALEMAARIARQHAKGTGNG